jgi:hypothetical protein
VRLPAGLTFIAHQHRPVHISVRGAKVKSLSLSHGELVISLTKAVSNLTVAVGRGALKESRSLRAGVRNHRVRALGLTIVALHAQGQRTTIRALVSDLRG